MTKTLRRLVLWLALAGLGACHRSVIYERGEPPEGDPSQFVLGPESPASYDPSIDLVASYAYDYSNVGTTRHDEPRNAAAAFNGSSYGVLWVERQFERSVLRFADVEKDRQQPVTGFVLDPNVPEDSQVGVHWTGNQFALSWTDFNGSTALHTFRALAPSGASAESIKASVESVAEVPRVSAWNGDLGIASSLASGTRFLSVLIEGRADHSVVFDGDGNLSRDDNYEGAFLRSALGAQEVATFYLCSRDDIRVLSVSRDRRTSIALPDPIALTSIDPSLRDLEAGDFRLLDVFDANEGLYVLYERKVQGSNPQWQNQIALYDRSRSQLVHPVANVGAPREERNLQTQRYSVLGYRLLPNLAFASGAARRTLSVVWCLDAECRSVRRVAQEQIYESAEGLTSNQSNSDFAEVDMPKASSIVETPDGLHADVLFFMEREGSEEIASPTRDYLQIRALDSREGPAFENPYLISKVLLGKPADQKSPLLAGTSENLHVAYQHGFASNAYSLSSGRLVPSSLGSAFEKLQQSLLRPADFASLSMRLPLQADTGLSGESTFLFLNRAGETRHSIDQFKVGLDGSFSDRRSEISLAPSFVQIRPSFGKCNGQRMMAWTEWKYDEGPRGQTPVGRHFVQAWSASGPVDQALEVLPSEADSYEQIVVGSAGSRCFAISTVPDAIVMQEIGFQEGGIYAAGDLRRIGASEEQAYAYSPEAHFSLASTTNTLLLVIDSTAGTRAFEIQSAGSTREITGALFPPRSEGRALISDGETYLMAWRKQNVVLVRRMNEHGETLLEVEAFNFPGVPEEDFNIALDGSQALHALSLGRFVLAYHRKDLESGAYRTYLRTITFGDAP